MDHRGFETVDEMHEYMIKQWNSKVRGNDEVVILGDFSIGKIEETTEILKRLNGKKYMIKGNHDKFLEKLEFDRKLFGWIEDYKEVSDNKRKVILSHYPIFCYNGQNRLDEKGNPKTYMLYGHVHNSYDEVLVNNFINMTRSSERISEFRRKEIPCQMINTFCMYSDYVPLSLDEWIENDRKRRDAMNEA